jgi:hypothetical protein
MLVQMITSSGLPTLKAYDGRSISPLFTFFNFFDSKGWETYERKTSAVRLERLENEENQAERVGSALRRRRRGKQKYLGAWGQQHTETPVRDGKCVAPYGAYACPSSSGICGFDDCDFSNEDCGGNNQATADQMKNRRRQPFIIRWAEHMDYHV